MAQPAALILRGPGTNCDLETAHAFEMAGAQTTRLHVNQLSRYPEWADKYQILCFAGGFSYGDDIAAGRIMAAQMEGQLADVLQKFKEEDRLILGICNGFQIMMRLGLFFENPRKPQATLAWNNSGRYMDRWVHLACGESECVFLNGLDRIFLPIAHAEGRVVFANEDSADQMDSDGQLPLRYEHDPHVETIGDAPPAPNGSQLNVAGMCDSSGRIFGLMPHPERHIFATQHPSWTRRETQPEHGEGLAIFRNAVDYFRN